MKLTIVIKKTYYFFHYCRQGHGSGGWGVRGGSAFALFWGLSRIWTVLFYFAIAISPILYLLQAEDGGIEENPCESIMSMVRPVFRRASKSGDRRLSASRGCLRWWRLLKLNLNLKLDGGATSIV